LKRIIEKSNRQTQKTRMIAANNSHSYTFKLAYTCQTISYLVDTNITMSKFMTLVKENVATEFNINANCGIEIVKSGQYFNTFGRDPELAPAIEASEQKIIEMFGNNDMTFYIRTIPETPV
jgi:hypothetical protein